MIRKIEEKDYQIYMEMTKAFYESAAVVHNIPEEHREETWKELLRSKDYVEAYILESEGDVAGYGLIAKTFSQEAGGKVVWVEELYVKEAYRSKGLGKEFFAFLDNMFQQKVRRLRLEVEPENNRAKKLYGSIGYEVLDYLQMVKERKG